MKSIIFHHPLPLDPNSKSASGIRPINMLNAFIELGYQVDLIEGYSEKRRLQIKQIKKLIENGKKYDFLYSESATTPTLLSDSHHLPLNPFLDFHFFKYLNTKKIPIGLFYRDIYWLFDEYSKSLPWIKSTIAKAFYRYDLKQYNKTLTKLYLPSIKMSEYIPIIKTSIFEPLPPGHSAVNISEEYFPHNNKLELLYIGGMSNHYQMHELFMAISEMNNVNLTICTRQNEWLQVKDQYISPLPNNIKIVHMSGKELKILYRKSDIAILFVRPHEYWSFASPVKLYEYIGEIKPIIASRGTFAGQFISENNIGWNIQYEKHHLITLLNSLLLNNNQILDKKKKIKEISNYHTWKSRALKVISDLTKNS